MDVDTGSVLHHGGLADKNQLVGTQRGSSSHGDVFHGQIEYFTSR